MSNRLLDVQVMEPNLPAIADLPHDVAVMRMENDTIMSLAAARPRDMVAIKKELGDLLEAFPKFAETAIYAKPVGKDESGKQKIARNLSVRSAELLAEVYGFNRVYADEIPIDADHVKIEGTFTDFQRGRIWRDGGIVSKFYRNKSGQMVRIADDRFYSVTVKAEKSKMLREVILRSVNAALKAWFWDQCEAAQLKILSPEKMTEIVAGFKTIGVDLEHLEIFLGRTWRQGWTVEDKKNLAGIWTAINDKETTVQEVFGLEDAKKQTKPPEPPGNGDVSGSDLTKGKAPTPPESAAQDNDRSSLAFPEEAPGEQEQLGLALVQLADSVMSEIEKLIEQADNEKAFDEPGRLMIGNHDEIVQARGEEAYKKLESFYQKRFKEVKGKKKGGK